MVNTVVIPLGSDPGSPTMPTPKYERVAEAIRSQIRSGAWKPNQQIPTVDALKAMYDVSYGTLRTALRDLYAEGWLEGRQGDGIFVTDKPPTGRPPERDTPPAAEE